MSQSGENKCNQQTKMNKYIYTLIALAALTGLELDAQTLQPAPRLVVNITIDQLRTDYIEHFSPLYGEGGFRKLLQKGCVYEAASYPFSPVDRASAIATIATGTTPHYNNIVGTMWLDRNTLRPVFCTDDAIYGTSPQKIATTTVGDELKIFTRGAGLVYSTAKEKDAAVISAGHAADGAFWLNDKTGRWTTSDYYSKGAQGFVRAFNSLSQKRTAGDNDDVAELSVACVNDMALGRDNITDMLSVTLSAKCEDVTHWQTEMEIAYVRLDHTLASLIKRIEDKVGSGNVLFVLTSTGYTDDVQPDYERFRIPTGTFYMNRSSNLLNMYLGAIFGQAKYVETTYRNQIYLDHKLIEQRHLSFTDIMTRSKELLVQMSGVRNVYASPYSPAVSGDIMIETAPGWQIINEDTKENYFSRAAFVPFPIILYGTGIKAEHIGTPATVDRIAPTIAKAIRIRAPNACSSAPLQ